MQNGKDIELLWFKKLLAIGVGVSLWWMSMTFSVKGFGAFQTNPNPDDAWIGWVLAFCVTAYELIWNSMKERTNLTMWVVGFLAYTYGIVTNVIGISEWMGVSGITPWMVFPVLLGIVIEIAPEPSFIWGLTGNYKGGDFLGNLFGDKVPVAPEAKSWGEGKKQTPMPDFRTAPKQPSKSYQPQHRPEFGRPSTAWETKDRRKEPTYHDPMEGYEEPRF